MSKKTIRVALAALFAAILLSGVSGLAQEKKSADEELDKFLQKLDESTAKPSEASQPTKEKEAKPADSEKAEAKPAESKSKAKPNAGSGSKKDEVAPQDQDLDSFLEKLGETTETPSPDERPGGPGPAKPADQPAPTESGKPARNALKGEAKDLDQHLEELTGRKHKKKNPAQGEGTGPLGKIVKEMRDVEERLGKPDTGEETRKKQTEIVKQLDQVIEQLKSVSNSQGRQMLRLVRQAGQRQGQQQGNQPGTTGGHAPNAKPAKPENKRSLAGGKDPWGHLPSALREEMENTSKEESLSKREDLIERYFLSLSKKTLTRGE